MQSIKSNALEPTRSELAELSPQAAIMRRLPVYGLPILTLLLIVGFSIVLPDTFPTALNARSILNDKAIIAADVQRTDPDRVDWARRLRSTPPRGGSS